MTKKGIIYVAFGQKYVDEALFSASSVKRHSPSLGITIFTDLPVAHAVFDSVVLIKPTHKFAKVDFIPDSPYDYTLFLDSDTEVVRDITDMFDILDRFDMAAVHDHARKSSRWSNKIPDYAAIPYGFSEFNTGVLLYRKSEKMQAFFESWRTHFYANMEGSLGQDQPSFRIAVWHSDVRMHTLPFEFNVRNESIRDKMKKRSESAADESLLKPRIFHWHGLNKKRLHHRFKAKYRAMKY
ncbi:glycosyltransferase [Pararhizobium polonicum]|uniref:glycosyltransferase n=1 Tax=Pararhizobium polonicum TaxID=1612624 RepID=UPI00083A810C|nr:glycosyltransferase [Pararhizobium polonicum]